MTVIGRMDRLLGVLGAAFVEGKRGGVIGRSNHLLAIAVAVSLIVDCRVGHQALNLV